jgi:hypothetical protein
MKKESRSARISRLFDEGTPIDRAMARAHRQALLEHKLLGFPIVAWRDGKVVEIPPEEIVIPPEVPPDDPPPGALAETQADPKAQETSDAAKSARRSARPSPTAAGSSTPRPRKAAR